MASFIVILNMKVLKSFVRQPVYRLKLYIRQPVKQKSVNKQHGKRAVNEKNVEPGIRYETQEVRNQTWKSEHV